VHRLVSRNRRILVYAYLASSMAPIKHAFTTAIHILPLPLVMPWLLSWWITTLGFSFQGRISNSHCHETMRTGSSTHLLMSQGLCWGRCGGASELGLGTTNEHGSSWLCAFSGFTPEYFLLPHTASSFPISFVAQQSNATLRPH